MEKAFIFDMDGVIINSEPIYHVIDSEIAENYGFSINEKEMEKYIGVRAKDMWASLLKEKNLDVDVNDVLISLNELQLKRIEESDLQPIDGIVELLRELKRSGYKIAIASSSPKMLIKTVLKRFQIESYFDCLVSGDEVTRGKPDPEIYTEATNRLKVDPNNCIVLEDSRAGIEAANKAGIRTIGFQNLSSGRQDLSNANDVVYTIEEVSGILFE